MKRLLSAIVILVILFITPIHNISAESMPELTFSLDDNFDDSSVLVILNEEYSKNYSVDLKISTLLNCTDVQDLTSYATSLFQEQINIIKDSLSATVLSTDLNDRLTIINEKLSLVNIDEFKRILRIELPTPGKENVLKAIELLNKCPEVYVAEPNIPYSICSINPNDSAVRYQWALDDIELPEAWEITTGYTPIQIGVIDSGVDYDHPDLSEKIGSRIFCSSDTYEYSSEHGTHVTGIIGATSNNDEGMAGIYRYDDTTARVFAFGRPSNSTWAYDELE